MKTLFLLILLTGCGNKINDTQLEETSPSPYEFTVDRVNGVFVRYTNDEVICYSYYSKSFTCVKK